MAFMMGDTTKDDWLFSLNHTDPARPNPRYISLSDLTGTCDTPALDQLRRQRIKSGEKKGEKDEKVGVLVPFGIVFGRGKVEGSVNRLVSPVISKFHCSMHITANGHVYLTDLGSSHGTTIRIRNTDTKTILPQSSAHDKSQKDVAAVVLRPHSPVQLLDGDIVVFGKKVVSTETTHQPLELCVKFRYPELGAAAEGGRKFVGTVNVEWAERHFVHDQNEGNLARLKRNIDKLKPNIPAEIDGDVEPKLEATSDMDENHSEAASSLRDSESHDDNSDDHDELDNGDEEEDEDEDEEETPSEYDAHYDDDDEEVPEQSEDEDKPDPSPEPRTPMKPTWAATPTIPQPEPASIRSNGSGKYGVPESVLYQSDDNDEPLPRSPPTSSPPPPSEPNPAAQVNSIDISLANAISPVCPPPAPATELSEAGIWQIKREATEHLVQEAREAAKKIREETALILANAEPESEDDEEDIGDEKEEEVIQPARKATIRRYGPATKYESGSVSVKSRTHTPQIEQDETTSPQPENTDSPALTPPKSPSTEPAALPPCWRVYDSSGDPVPPRSSSVDYPSKPKVPRRPYTARAFQCLGQRTYEELDENDMYDLEALWEDEEKEEAAQAAIEAAKKAAYEKGLRDGEQRQKEAQQQIDEDKPHRIRFLRDQEAMDEMEEQSRILSQNSAGGKDHNDNSENDEEDMDIMRDEAEEDDSDQATSDTDDAPNHEAQEVGYRYRASDDEAEEPELGEGGDVDWERFFADDIDDDDAPPLVLKTGPEMDRKGKQVDWSSSTINEEEAENSRKNERLVASFIKAALGPSEEPLTMTMDTAAATSSNPAHPAQVGSVDQASQTETDPMPRHIEQSIQTEPGSSLEDQPGAVAENDTSDTSSSAEDESVEERDKDDAQTVFDIVDTGVRTPQVDMDAEMEEISRGWGIDRPIRPIPGPSSGCRPFAIPLLGPKSKQDKKREKRDRQMRKTRISDISQYRAGAHIRLNEQFEQVSNRVDNHISLADREARWSDLSASHEPHPPRHSFSSGSDGSSPGPVTPKFSLRPLKRSAHVAFDEPDIVDTTPSSGRARMIRNLYISPSEKRAGMDHLYSPPSKRARLASTMGTVGSVFGLVVLGAALGSVGTIAGLMQLAD